MDFLQTLLHSFGSRCHFPGPVKRSVNMKCRFPYAHSTCVEIKPRPNTQYCVATARNRFANSSRSYCCHMITASIESKKHVDQRGPYASKTRGAVCSGYFGFHGLPSACRQMFFSHTFLKFVTEPLEAIFLVMWLCARSICRAVRSNTPLRALQRITISSNFF